MKVKHSKNSTQSRKIVEMENNPVREYLKAHPTKILSIHHLKKNLPETMKKRQIYYYCNHSNFIRRASPHEVGSEKTD